MANNWAAWHEFSKADSNGSLLLNIVLFWIKDVNELVFVVDIGWVVGKIEWFVCETGIPDVGCTLLWLLLCNARSSWFVVVDEVGGGGGKGVVNDGDVTGEAVTAKIGAVI